VSADVNRMFVFATAEPWGAYHLTPLVPIFGTKALHLTPDHEPEHPTIPATTDMGVLARATAVIITGGTINEWTEKVGESAADHGVPVFFIELAYAHEAPYYRKLSWIEHAFAGSENSRQQLASHLMLPPDKVSVIGYPHLDGIIPISETDLQNREPHLLFLGTIENDTWNNALQSAANSCRELGYTVTYRFHPRDRANPRTLQEDLQLATGVIGAPGTAFLAVAALGLPVWYPQHESLQVSEGAATMARLAHPLPINSFEKLAVSLDKAFADYAPHNPDIVEYYVGPLTGKAAENFHLKLMLHGTSFL